MILVSAFYLFSAETDQQGNLDYNQSSVAYR